jgi:hypothetical protein
MNKLRASETIDEAIAALIDSPWFQHGLDESPQAVSDHLMQHMREEMRNYRFRNFHQVKDLLKDKRGVDIPRDILEIIVACMIRDVDGSFYRRDPAKGFSSDVNYEAATRIHNAARDLLSGPNYRLPEREFPNPLDWHLLFKLRSLAQQPSMDLQVAAKE